MTNDGDMMHTAHFMTLVTLNSLKGWAAPVELPPEQPQDGVLVVPVSPQLEFFPQYRLDWTIYRGSGQYDNFHCTMQSSASGWLNVVIDGKNVKFRKSLRDGQPRCFKYVGALTHNDFALPLCEIEAEVEQVLDDLYDKKKIVVSGCVPDSEYGGLAQFIASHAGREKIH